MKKALMAMLLMLGMTAASAQEVIVGDMNDDNQLNISDVTTLVSTLIGKTPVRKISIGSGDAYSLDNSSVVGTWRTTDGKVLTFNADGTCSFGAGYTYDFAPQLGSLVIYTPEGLCHTAYTVLRKSADFLLLNQIGTTVGSFYYTSNKFVTAVKLSKTTASINTGQTVQLTATVTPSDAMTPTLKWTSSSTSIATVDQTGLVTGKKGGKATITATATDGTGVKATCSVSVTQLVTSIALDYTALTIGKGAYLELNANVSPSTANNKELTWTSSNTAAVAVMDNLIKGKAAGSSTITAAATDGSGKKATCKVTVLSVTPTDVTLSNSSFIIEPTKTAQFTATVVPSSASSCTVIWTSSDPSIATVDKTGKVTGVAAGKTTITATVAGTSSIVASAEVTVQNDTHEYIDLGLSVNWATCNVGADSPEDYGGYYAWGETKAYGEEDMSNTHNYIYGSTYTKTFYSWSTYKWCSGTTDEGPFTKYNTSSSYGTVDNKQVIDLVDDAAYVNWGNNWRMPTDAEWTELRDNCTWTWTTQNGKNGYKVTGLNGNSIFLPTTGFRYSNGVRYTSSKGNYWSSSLNVDEPNCVWFVNFDSENVNRGNVNRCLGRNVRPVRRQ